MNTTLQLAPRIARRLASTCHHQWLYHGYRRATMVPKPLFMQNLRLADSVRSVPGCVVECGVWRGGMIAALAHILGKHRNYYLFDSFEGLPPAQPIDGPAAQAWQSSTTAPTFHNNCTAPLADAQQSMARAGAANAHFIKGWFEDTLKNFKFPEPIAVLRLDGDWYDSTMTALQAGFDQVSVGGLIIVDDYATWDGCSRAVHDFLSHRQLSERLLVHGGVYYLQKTASR